MHAEVISVGTEILLGQITDTNSTFISQRLAELGIDVYFKTVVGDNEKRLLQALEIASGRSDMVILSGGLGPTKDDLTKQTVAKFLNCGLLTDKNALEYIEEYYRQNNRKMTDNNLLQAKYLEGSVSLPNESGMAVGSYYQNQNGPDFILLPGPPSEMRPMFDKEAMPRLKKKYAKEHLLFSRVLRFYGIGESQLVTELDDLINGQTNPTIAPYAKVGEVTLRLTAQADSKESAKEILDETEQVISKRVGQYLYGYGDDNSLPKVVVEKLKQRGLTVSASESLTGGSFQKAVTDIAGSSQIFPGGFVTYSASAKENLLDIPKEIIIENGVVSEATAKWMAERTRIKMDTDFGVSFTGVAGPDTLEGNPAGTVWIGISQRGRQTAAFEYHFYGDRDAVRVRSVLAGFDLINKKL
ncbi:competence/damage-inducible protein A [uncultured Ligilactobacillus sp.]|uniref:competence/damage-inducible protein A n=1 Tax=uncultured Ligilactobacillus sp. TaxID=2837633 RepID=UPI002594CEB1|nr:competence/damage-inducible protein A [uncultured Ligilactobacillus sp.]